VAGRRLVARCLGKATVRDGNGEVRLRTHGREKKKTHTHTHKPWVSNETQRDPARPLRGSFFFLFFSSFFLLLSSLIGYCMVQNGFVHFFSLFS
jgi:hypothetical protein